MTVHIPVAEHTLVGDLSVPPRAPGIVVFAHGSGSSRHSPRNQYVARAFERRGLATLLIDLLDPDEEQMDARTRQFRFDIPMLAGRLAGIAEWLKKQPDTASLTIGLFGASTGAGAALLVAAAVPRVIAAVVSRGGRPDLAGGVLELVRAPTLLIVGGLDHEVIDLNRAAMRQMRGEVALEIVPGATHLFEESGALDRVAALAGAWFARHLRPVTTHPFRGIPEAIEG